MIEHVRSALLCLLMIHYEHLPLKLIELVNLLRVGVLDPVEQRHGILVISGGLVVPHSLRVVAILSIEVLHVFLISF